MYQIIANILRHCMGKGKGQQLMEHRSFPLEFQLADGKDILQTAQRYYQLTTRKEKECASSERQSLRNSQRLKHFT